MRYRCPARSMITNSSRRKQDVGSMKADGGIDDLYMLDGDR